MIFPTKTYSVFKLLLAGKISSVDTFQSSFRTDIYKRGVTKKIGPIICWKSCGLKSMNSGISGTVMSMVLMPVNSSIRRSKRCFESYSTFIPNVRKCLPLIGRNFMRHRKNTSNNIADFLKFNLGSKWWTEQYNIVRSKLLTWLHLKHGSYRLISLLLQGTQE